MICNIELFLILLVDWLLVTETACERYTRSYDGYIFTLPDLNPYGRKDEAQSWCTQNGSTLLEIKSSYVRNLTVRFLSDTGVQFGERTLLFTNGVREGDSRWNWVNGQEINSITVTDQGQDLARSFGYIDFNFNPSRLPYVVASIPREMRGYICQGKFDCTNGFLLNKLCHKSFNSPTMSWFDARNRCLDEGGDLASFDFINDTQGLNSTLNGSWFISSTTYWIGIRRQWWTWQTSNLEIRRTNWLNGRPEYRLENRCLCLYKTGVDWKWIECNCDSPCPFVCLTEQRTTPSISSSTTQDTTRISTTSSGFRSTTAIYSNLSTMEPPSSTGTVLGIGIGVGIGGALIIAAIIVVVFVVIRKLGCPRKSPPSNPPDVTLNPIESHYVEIPRQPGYENNSTSDANSNQYTPPAVYADLEILTGSPLSQEKDSISLINPKTATLAPPSTHKATTHFTVDGQEYAEVKEVRI